MPEYHDELFDGDRKPNVHRYCCPILIGSFSFGALLAPPEHVLVQPGKELPVLRSGTLTFVRYGGEVFGITCAHVVAALDAEIEQDRRENRAIAGNEAAFPPEVWKRFFLPRGDTHYDINVKFHLAEDKAVDLAAGWIPAEVFAATGREAISIDEPLDLSGQWPTEVGALASGYPEANRRIYGRESPDDTLALSNVTLHSTIEEPSGKKIRMLGALASNHPTDVDVLSGMSGGPLIATVGDRWGLVGIISSGPNLHSYSKCENQGFFDTPAINIECEAIDLPTLRLWLQSLKGIRTERPTKNIRAARVGRVTLISES